MKVSFLVLGFTAANSLRKQVLWPLHHRLLRWKSEEDWKYEKEVTKISERGEKNPQIEFSSSVKKLVTMF